MPETPVAAANWLFDLTMQRYTASDHDRAKTDYFFATAYPLVRDTFDSKKNREDFIVEVFASIKSSELGWLQPEPPEFNEPG